MQLLGRSRTKYIVISLIIGRKLVREVDRLAERVVVRPKCLRLLTAVFARLVALFPVRKFSFTLRVRTSLRTRMVCVLTVIDLVGSLKVTDMNVMSLLRRLRPLGGKVRK